MISQNKFLSASIFLLFIFLLFFGMIEARGFLVPLFVSITFAYLIYPVSGWLEKKGFNRVIASLIGIIALLSIVILFLSFVFTKIHQILSDSENILAQANHNLKLMEGFIRDTFGISFEDQNKWLKNLISSLLDSSSEFSQRFFKATTSTLFKMALIPVFIFYFLQFRERFSRFFYEVANEKHREITAKFIDKVSFVTPRYIGGVFIVVCVLVILNSIGLLIIGLKYAIFFGVISAIFNFIPYFGTWIGAFFPFTFALLTGESPNQALYVLVLFVIIQFTENNILTPNITGGYVDINPLFTILSIMIGGILWGIAGMFVIIPMVATLKIYCDFFPNLQPISRLISAKDNPRHSRRINWIRNLMKMDK